MTSRALHSAVLEVGLFYEKRWSEDRIARFTDRLNRRRLREQKAAARARAAQAPAERPMVAYQVEQAQPAAGMAIGIAESTAETPPAKQRSGKRVARTGAR